MSNWSSFENDKLLMESWRKYLEDPQADLDEGVLDRLKGLNPFSKLRKRGYEDVAAEFDAEDAAAADTPEPAAPEAPEPAAPEPAAPASTDAEVGMPISGTEFATMNFLVKGKLLDIIRKAAMTGAAAKDPASKNLLQLFNKEFFPALVKMTKNPNIDIAEGIDMDEFLLEMLNEADDAMTRRQQAAMKGKLRSRGGMQNYLKSAGGKPPIIANNIRRALEKALSQNVNADSLFDAAAEVSSTIQNPKEKAQYEKRYTDLMQKAPEKRIANYKQNVAAFVGAVSDLATKAAAKALAADSNFAADKASRTAAGRRPAEPEAAPSAPAAADPTSARASRSAVSRMRSRDRRGTSGVFKGVTESKKTWKISKDGNVSRIDNEKK